LTFTFNPENNLKKRSEHGKNFPRKASGREPRATSANRHQAVNPFKHPIESPRNVELLNIFIPDNFIAIIAGSWTPVLLAAEHLTLVEKEYNCA
jgi:hypothetical protein